MIVILLHIVSCEKITVYGDVVEDSNLLNSLYNNSKDTIIIESKSYITEADLTRNFYPSFLPTNKKLFTHINLVNIDSLPVPNTIDIIKLYVVNDQQIWISNPLRDESDFVPVYKICRVSKNGPKWDTDIFVDVVIKIENESTMKSYLLIAKEQQILMIE